MSPIRRMVSSALGLVLILVGGYMIYGLIFLGFGGKFWMFASSAAGVFIGGYLIWADGIAPMLGKEVD